MDYVIFLKLILGSVLFSGRDLPPLLWTGNILVLTGSTMTSYLSAWVSFIAIIPKQTATESWLVRCFMSHSTAKLKWRLDLHFKSPVNDLRFLRLISLTLVSDLTATPLSKQSTKK